MTLENFNLFDKKRLMMWIVWQRLSLEPVILTNLKNGGLNG
jgi:hypothetical protein